LLSRQNKQELHDEGTKAEDINLDTTRLVPSRVPAAQILRLPRDDARGSVGFSLNNYHPWREIIATCPWCVDDQARYAEPRSKHESTAFEGAGTKREWKSTRGGVYGEENEEATQRRR
jgi:hypothetical protein